MNQKVKSKSAGRPTIDKHSLAGQRNIILDMFACWWGEVGWQITRASTREELRAALAPLTDHPNRHFINRLLLATTVSASAEEIRQARKALERAVKQIYETQDQERRCSDSVQQAKMALGQASPDQIEIVNAELSRRKSELEEATQQYRAACEAQQELQKKLDLIEAGFAQDELLMFIDKRFINGNYARTPQNLADAIAGLPFASAVPFMGVWQSYVRCSKLKCQPHHRFQQFEIIESILKKSRESQVPFVEFFHQQISKLQKHFRVKRNDPMTGEEFEDQVENSIRSDFFNFWPIWKMAIQKSVDSLAEKERMPFLICANFTLIQRDPKSTVYMVLGASKNTEN